MIFEQRVAGLTELFESWAKGDFSPAPDFYGGSLEWGMSEDFPDVGTATETGTSKQLARWLEQWDDWRVESEQFFDAGDQVVVFARFRGRGKTSGLEVDVAGAQIWTFQGAEAMRMVIYMDRDAALRDAGLDSS